MLAIFNNCAMAQWTYERTTNVPWKFGVLCQLYKKLLVCLDN